MCSSDLDPPHSGVVIAQEVMECLAEWKIEDKVISLTLDNASSNDVATKNLMAKFVARKVPGFLPNHFHVRCCAHIVNLVVNDGLQPLLPFINQLRRSPLRNAVLTSIWCNSRSKYATKAIIMRKESFLDTGEKVSL